MDELTKAILFKKIAEKSEINNETGCHIWTGSRDKKLNILYYKKRYSVHNLVWNIHNPDNIVNNKIENCVHTCNNDMCVSIDHLAKVSLIKPELTKKELWNELLKKSTRQENGCLFWTGTIIKGYGIKEIKGKNNAVHRLSYLINNDIDTLPNENETSNFIVRHLCNNKLCFEPKHLALGSRIDNKQDEVDSGVALRGTKLHNTLIDEHKAKRIKWSKYEPGDEKYKTKYERSIMFEVSESLINSIDSGSSWSYIPDRDGGSKTKDLNEVIRKRNRETRKAAMRKEWTRDMFAEAEKILLERTTVTTYISTPYVSTPCRIWKGKPTKNNYGTINIFGKKIQTHILAAEISRKTHKKDSEIARHLCGNTLCCALDHVVFGTKSENSRDMLLHGTCHFSKLSEEEVREIRKTMNDGMMKKDKAKKYNINVNTLRNIEKNKTWQHVKI